MIRTIKTPNMFNIKLIIITIVSLGLNTIWARPTDTIATYYDRHWNAVDNVSEAVFQGKMYRNDSLWVFENYYNNGQLHMSGAYLDKAATLPTGKFLCLYETGKARAVLKYTAGKLDGRQIEFWENGELKRQELYKKNKYLLGGIFDTLGAEIYYPPEWVCKLCIGDSSQLIHTLDTLVFYENEALNMNNAITQDFCYGEMFFEDSVWFVKYYDIDDKVCMSGAYLNDTSQVKTGVFNYYHDNGKVKRKLKYCNGQLNGLVLGYSDNEELIRRELYENDSLMYGKVFDYNGNEIDYYPYFSHAEYTGGEEELIKFLSLNVKYPEVCMENGFQGRVYVSFTISKQGEIEDVGVMKSVHYSFDREAIRVIRLMTAWHPAKIENVPVACKYRLPINFTLRDCVEIN